MNQKHRRLTTTIALMCAIALILFIPIGAVAQESTLVSVVTPIFVTIDPGNTTTVKYMLQNMNYSETCAANESNPIIITPNLPDGINASQPSISLNDCVDISTLSHYNYDASGVELFASDPLVEHYNVHNVIAPSRYTDGFKPTITGTIILTASPKVATGKYTITVTTSGGTRELEPGNPYATITLDVTSNKDAYNRMITERIVTTKNNSNELTHRGIDWDISPWYQSINDSINNTDIISIEIIKHPEIPGFEAGNWIEYINGVPQPQWNMWVEYINGMYYKYLSMPLADTENKTAYYQTQRDTQHHKIEIIFVEIENKTAYGVDYPNQSVYVKNDTGSYYNRVTLEESQNRTAYFPAFQESPNHIFETVYVKISNKTEYGLEHDNQTVFVETNTIRPVSRSLAQKNDKKINILESSYSNLILHPGRNTDLYSYGNDAYTDRISYRIRDFGGECTATSTDAPVNISINTPEGITASPNKLQLSGCEYDNYYLKFNASPTIKPGRYTITSNVTGGTGTLISDPYSTFTICVPNDWEDESCASTSRTVYLNESQTIISEAKWQGMGVYVNRSEDWWTKHRSIEWNEYIDGVPQPIPEPQLSILKQSGEHQTTGVERLHEKFGVWIDLFEAIKTWVRNNIWNL